MRTLDKGLGLLDSELSPLKNYSYLIAKYRESDFEKENDELLLF